MKSNMGELDVQYLMPLAESGMRQKSRRPRRLRLNFVAGVFCFLVIIIILAQISYRNSGALTNKVLDSKPLFGKAGVYKGNTWTSKQTVSKIIVAETKFARCDIHSVRTEDGTLISDWLFLEERDAINAVVINMAGQFVVFRQSKYAIEGETLSPVGGFIDDGETPIQAAKREVKEELGLGSRASTNSQGTNLTENDPDWISLGNYRTGVNRGGGFTHLFLLKQAVPLLPDGGTPHYKGSGDNESQSILLLTNSQILNAISKAQFQEVKWTAALSLSLLHLQGKISPITNIPLLK